MATLAAQNPFFILGVSADAEMSVIQSVGKRRLMALRLDDDADPAMVAAIDGALEELADPVVRFEKGLFALELTDTEAEAFRVDPVLSTFASNPTQDGVAAYKRICESKNPITLAHNRGILRFNQAVAATQEAQEGTPDDIADDLACVRLWKDAYKYLRPVFGSNRFWKRQKLRAKGYDDKRLGPDRIQKIRSESFGRMVDPVGRVISRALLDRHAKVAKAYVDLLRTSGFEAALVEQTLSEVYTPIADRVEARVNSIQSRLEAKGETSAAYRGAFKEFEKHVGPDLEVMLKIGNLPGYAEEHARDSSAAFLRSLAIDIANKSEDYGFSKTVLAAAARFADSASLATKLKNDQSVLDEVSNQSAELEVAKACAFCGSASATEVFAVAMHRVTGRNSDSVEYQTAEVELPRCSDCLQRHKKQNAAGCAWQIGLLVVLGIPMLFAVDGSHTGWSVVLLFACGAAVVLPHMINKQVRSRQTRKHPILRHFESEGFVHGEKPSP